MELSHLPSITKRSKKRVGRGFGSGKGGHTAGRGRKGQRSREDIPLMFEGGPAGASLVKRLPFLRGKGKHKSHTRQPVIINVSSLNNLPKNATVDVKLLVKHGLVDEKKARTLGVKLLGDGEVTVPLTITIPHSSQAAKKIEKAGGSIVLKKA